MRKIFTLIVAMAFVAGAFAQTLTNLAYFPFTGNQATPSTPTSYISAYGEQAGSAGLYLDGTHGSSSWTSDELTANNGTTLNAQYGLGSDKDLATINQSANGKSIVFHFSTTGYQNVIMTMASRRSQTGFNSTVWAYSTDGTNFTTLPNFSTTPDTISTYRLQTLDFTGFSALDDQPNVYLRCTYDGATANNGSFRIDNVLIAAAPAGPDIWAPVVTSVVATDTQTVTVTFNESVSAATAQNVANYAIDNNITVTAASLTGTTVTLTTSPLTPGDLYTMIISNVADAIGNVMNPDTVTFSYGVSHDHQCATIAELRSKLAFTDNSGSFDGTEEYELTGEVIVTAVASYNNQKVLQDETGAILVYDPSNKIGTLTPGDKISGLYGTLTNYWGFLEFKPTQTFTGVPSAVYQTVTPLDITLEQLNDQEFMIQHQAEMLRLNNVTFNSTGAFAVLTTYEITQNGVTANAVYPYFQDANYIGADIPTGTLPSLVGFNFATSKIGNTHPDFRYYIVPRSSDDFVTTSILDLNQKIAVYPNPTTDRVMFQMEKVVSVAAVYDMNGRLVANPVVNNNSISLTGLNAGVYFVRLYGGDELIGTTKVVKY